MTVRSPADRVSFSVVASRLAASDPAASTAVASGIGGLSP